MLRALLLVSALGLAVGCSSSNVGAASPSPTPLPPSPPAADAMSVEQMDVAGTWEFTMSETPAGQVTGSFVIRREGSGYTGSMTENYTGQSSALEDITVEGDKMSMFAAFDVEGQAIDLYIEGTVRGDAFSGQVDIAGMGTSPIEATRR